MAALILGSRLDHLYKTLELYWFMRVVVCCCLCQTKYPHLCVNNQVSYLKIRN